jgi:hypothetical protein
MSTNPLKFQLCTDAACYTIFFEPWQSDDAVATATAVRIEEEQGIELEPYERQAIRAKISAARKEAR